jgi:hypothetical protein
MTDKTNDRERLAALEAEWERHERAIGAIAREIRDDRLYKTAGHRTWATYCEERWSRSASQVDRWIAAERDRQRLALELTPNGVPAPTRESHLRVLRTTEDPAGVWRQVSEQAAMDGRKPTAADILRVSPQTQPVTRSEPVAYVLPRVTAGPPTGVPSRQLPPPEIPLPGALRERAVALAWQAADAGVEFRHLWRVLLRAYRDRKDGGPPPGGGLRAVG